MLENRTVDIAVGRFSKPTQHNLFRYEPLGTRRSASSPGPGIPCCARGTCASAT